MKNSHAKNGIVHGRFQPPHNGHSAYMLAALQKTDHLSIGICTPDICSAEVAQKTGFPCTAEENPFTYGEREGMIRAALLDAGITQERFSFLTFPSDYADIETLVPKETVFFISVTGRGDTEKIRHLESLGYKTETIMTISSESDRAKSGAIRKNAQQGGTEWQQSVPEAVCRYIAEHNLAHKLFPTALKPKVLH